VVVDEVAGHGTAQSNSRTPISASSQGISHFNSDHTRLRTASGFSSSASRRLASSGPAD